MTNEDGAWPGVDKAAIEREIRAEEAKWTAELNARDADALIAHGEPEGISNFANPGVETTYEESRELMEEALKDPNYDCKFHTDYFGIADSGEWAYCRGEYEFWGTDSETQQAVVTSKGSYINVWKKDAAGNWRTVEDMLVPLETKK